MKKIVLSALSLSLMAVAGGAMATDVTGSFQVTASVQGTCKVSSTQAIAFGTYDPTNVNASTDLTANGKVSVQCTSGTESVAVKLDQGANPATGSSVTSPLRQLKSAEGNYLSYQIYSDSGLGSVWGSDASNLKTLPTFTSSLVPVDLVTYGKIPAAQNAAIGSYTDTVGVTVTF